MNSKFEDSRSAGPRPSRSDSNPSDCHLPARDFSNLLNPQIPSSPDSASEHVHNPEQAADKHAVSSSHHNPAVVDNRPKRKRITQEQLVDLLSMFEQTNTPSFEVREQLANKLNMTNREVQVWFQNRRAKVNRAQLQQAPRFYHHGGSGMIAPHHVNLYPHPYHFVALNQTEPVVMHESMSNPSQSSRHPHHSDASNMGIKFNPPSTFSSRSYRRGNTFIPAPIKVTPYTIPGTHAHTNPNPAHSPPILSPSDPSNHRISHSARTVSFSSALPSPLDSAGLSSLPSLFRDSLNIQSPTTPISAISDLRTPNSANTRPIVSPLNSQFSKALPSPSTHAYSHPIESPSSSHFNIPSSAKLNPLPSIKELGLDRLS